MNSIKTLAAVLAPFALAAGLATGTASAQPAAPQAGQFCSSLVAGSTTAASKGRTVRCEEKGGTLRWVVIG